MVLYPAFILTIFAPGFFFPEMANNNNTSNSSSSSSSSSRMTSGPDAEKEEKDVPGTVTA